MQIAKASHPKVGDVCWLNVSGNKNTNMWERNWRVVEVGIPNKHGYKLDVRIKKDGWKNKGEVVSPFDEEEVLFLVPEEECPAAMVKFLKKSPQENQLLIVRNVCNSDRALYALLCTECMKIIHVEIQSTETATFGFNAGKDNKFEVGEPNYEHGDETLTCDCDIEYDIPKETERA